MLPLEPGGPQTDLRHYARVAWRRKWLLAGFVLTAVVAAYVASSSQTPLYRASGEVRILPKRAEQQVYFFLSPQEIEAEVRSAAGGEVARRVVEAGGVAAPVAVRQVGQSDILSFSVTSRDPELAASSVNAYIDAYLAQRQEEIVAELVRQKATAQDALDQVNAELQPIEQELASVAARVESPRASELRARQERLLDEQSIRRQSLRELNAQQSQADPAADKVSAAVPPSSPFEPRPMKDAFTALAVALVLGLGAVFLLDHLDDAIRSKDDVDRISGSDLPVLGLIPAMAGRKRDAPSPISSRQPQSAAAEAYRSLRTSIQFLGLDRATKTIQVTSPSASEGKTTTIANLGVVLGRAGQTVVVVCCDLRRPRVHEFFGLDNAVGFTSVLLGEVPLQGALQSVPGEERLYLLASGPPPPNPAELLTSRRTAEVMTALQANADIVLIDCPPVLPVTDAAVLSASVDATLVVATARTTKKTELRRALELLRQVDAPLIGMVLNGVGDDDNYGGYGYRGTYPSQPNGNSSWLGERIGRRRSPPLAKPRAHI